MHIICNVMFILTIGSYTVKHGDKLGGYVVSETPTSYTADFSSDMIYAHPHMSKLVEFRRLTVNKSICKIDK